MAGRFDGKVLFATGAASGIGASTARRFAAEGGRVAVADLDGASADAVAAELDGAAGVACDVSDERSVEEAVREAHERLGRIDCVFNAAGIVKFTSEARVGDALVAEAELMCTMRTVI